MIRNLCLRILFCFAFSTLAISPQSFARSGGGHTSSSGSSGGGSHSSGGSFGGGSSFGGSSYHYSSNRYSNRDDGPVNPFIVLVVIMIVFFVFISMNRAKKTQGEDRASTLLRNSQMAEQERQYSARPPFNPEQIRQFDPQFSVPAFMDFVYALYATVHKLRGEKRVSELSAYASPTVIARYGALSPYVTEVKGIVISSFRIISEETTPDSLQVRVAFEANYTESAAGLPDRSYYTEESWLLKKKKTALSSIPSKMRQISCPACGAPPSFSDDGKCSACGKYIKRGDFTWSIEEVTPARHQIAPQLTSTVEEVGTDRPTILAPDLLARETEFAKLHPDFKLSQLTQRAANAYFAAQNAWTQRKPEIARPFESENIFQMHQYWINEYLKQGLVNVLKDVKLFRCEVAKLARDAFFESMTLRMYGSMIDYTVKAGNNSLVAGDPNTPREFTEYWTFIRSVNSSGAKKFDNGCPACGAPLKINQSGHCEYCQAMVTSGEFDWVLSQIEQDEAYRG